MSKGWTQERRRAQAERCRQNKPWKNATGPRTREGKARSSLNAYKHGYCSRVMPDLQLALQLNKAFLKALHRYASFLQMADGVVIQNELIKRQLNQRG